MIETATEIVEKLKKTGYKAYFVGGCVRDLILGNKDPKDIDIATSAHPEEIEKLFSHTKPVGKEFGVILVIENGKSFEVATFRKESDYVDARHPSKVTFSDEKTDAARRDFTVNGMFYDPIEKKVIDYVGGQDDLKNKTLRFIGEPYERIKEDHLRILRALRFKNTLNLEYEPKTKEALKDLAILIKDVSAERVRDELNKMFSHESRIDGLKELDEFGLLKILLPEIETMKGVQQPKNFHSEGDVFVHTMLCMENLPRDCASEVAWAMLLHDVAKPETFKIREGRATFYGHVKKSADKAAEILKRFKFSNDQIDKIHWLIRKHLIHHDLPKMKIARARRLLQNPYMAELFIILEADARSSLPIGIKLDIVGTARKMWQEEQVRPKPPQPLLSGTEIMEILKIEPGSKVGEIIKALEDAQLEDEVKTEEEARDLVKKFLL